MNPQWTLAALLALAVLLAWGRLLLPRRAPVRGWRLGLLLFMQPLCAGLLYFTLLPPALPTQAGTMTVLTAGATRAQLRAQGQGDALVALPEAPVVVGAEPMPDLATALRRHPQTERLRIVGAGLEARDRDAARGRPLQFEPPPLPRGLVSLDAPRRVAAGDSFPVAGQAHDVAGGEVRLLDPAGRAVDAVRLDGDGRFRLVGTARAPGTVLYSLQVRDAAGAEVEVAEVPLWIADDPPPRVLLLAGAPNPEFRHLRRWAEDAGVQLHAEVSVGGGVGLGEGAPSREALGGFDLVVLDERAWAALDGARRAALSEALREGTGVLLRATAPLSDGARRRLRALGLAVSAAGGTDAVRFPAADDEGVLRARLGPGSADAPFDASLAGQAPPPLTRRALRIENGDAVPLLHDATGVPLAHWRAEGRGRIGLWTVTDSYRLVLAGRGDLHAELWSTVIAALARARTDAVPVFEAAPWAGQRMAICALGDEARIRAPGGTSASLLVDPAAGTARCAAYWPRKDGWHVLRQGDDAWPFHVRAAASAPGLVAATLRGRTLRMAGADVAPPKTGAAPRTPRRGASWPWFLAWLAAASALWWLERSRLGTAWTRPR